MISHPAHPAFAHGVHHGHPMHPGMTQQQAAVMIQSHFRGEQARFHTPVVHHHPHPGHLMHHGMTQTQAAVMIQSHFRGEQVRMHTPLAIPHQVYCGVPHLPHKPPFADFHKNYTWNYDHLANKRAYYKLVTKEKEASS
jgi:hypothetical protein